MELLLFCIKMKNNRIQYFCFGCKSKRCRHSLENISDLNSEKIHNSYQFEIDNDFESESVDVHSLISSESYPCMWFVCI